MLKICTATSYTQDFARVGNICATTLKIYSTKYGYISRVIPNLVMPDRPASWHRIRFIRELFDEGFDFVFWMDADALFLRYDRDISEIIEPGKDLYMVRHPIPKRLRPYYGLSSDEPIPNNGVLLLRNCEWTRGFLEEIWNREEYRDHPWWENAAVIDLFGYFGILGKGEDQPNKDLLDHVKFIDLEWNSMPIHCSALFPIVHHYGGLTQQIRINKMTTDYFLSTSSLSEELDSIFYRIGARDGFVVQQGPFAGMAYLSQVRGHYFLRGSAFLPKLLGTYEVELHDVIAHIATKPYATVVNVGCGEGYYAVGMARLLPQAHIYASDNDQCNQEWCAELARLNNVADRITIAEKYDPELLPALTTKPTLLVLDSEGFELDLLRPDVLPGLRLCDVLVKLYDSTTPSISQTIRERFASTHTVITIDSKEPDSADNPVLSTLSMQEQRLAMEEFHPITGVQWAFMTATR